MSNSINRQDLSDYENNLGAWRKMASTYNAKVGDYNADLNTYNAGAGDYNAQIAAYNEKINPYNASVNDWKAKVASGEYVASGDGNYYRDPTFGMTDQQKAESYNINTGFSGPNAGYGGIVTPPEQPNLGPQPVQPNIVAPDKTAVGASPKTPEAPTFTLQQTKDINKSDSPLADAERGEAGKFSPFKSEEGLIQRAMKGFK